MTSQGEAGPSNGLLRPVPIPTDVLERLSPESRACIASLQAHDAGPLPDLGTVRKGAVLVALYQEEGEDELKVLLTTRAKTLRSHPNQTALPGGMVDPEDPSPVHTAYREAYEEVGLPLNDPNVHHLGVLEPTITILPLNAHMKSHIIIIPVICLVSSASVIANLKRNPSEVEYIFSHPLRAIFDGQVTGKAAEDLAERGGEDWPHPEDQHSIENRVGVTGDYRMHRFRTTHTPLKGITSDVLPIRLISTATVAFGSPLPYTRFAPDQLPFSEIIARVVRELPEVLKAEAGRPKDEPVVKKNLYWGQVGSDEMVLSNETWHARA